MAGLFDDLLGIDQGGGLFGNWLSSNSNALIGLGAGIAGGGTWNDAVSRGLAGFGSGRGVDQRHQAMNATMAGLVQQGMSPEQARLAVLNPEIMKALIPSIVPKYEYHANGPYFGAFNPANGNFNVRGAVPEWKSVNPGDTAGYVTPPVPGAPQAGAGNFAPVMRGGPKVDDVSGLRKEISALPEVKRYTEALPIFRSMTQSHAKDTAAADLDFVYGVAKIFDPESVVREGEMKLVGQAQSLPQDVQGWIKRVAFGEGRLDPVARARILDVARTRMGEYQGAYQQRIGGYPDIAKRWGMNPQDVMPNVQELPDAPKIPKEDNTIPATMRGKPADQQLQAAPVGSIAIIDGVRSIKGRDGKWSPAR